MDDSILADRLRDLLNGEVTVAEFEEWFIPQAMDIGSPTPFANAVLRDLSEHTANPGADLDILLRRLAGRLDARPSSWTVATTVRGSLTNTTVSRTFEYGSTSRPAVFA